MAKRPTRPNSYPELIVTAPKAPEAAVLGNVEYIRHELSEMMPTYEIIRDCIDGQAAVKRAGDKYLPRPNPDDRSVTNLARYESYKSRAVFYNVTRRTLAGLVGEVFLQDPVVEVPPLLDAVVKDANGSGVSLIQLAKQAENFVIAHGRAGLLADYPTVDGPATRAQQKSGDIRPVMTVYAPWNVINWRTTLRGGRLLLSLVVLREEYNATDDGFETKVEVQYRVLRLVDNVYTVEIWRKSGGASGYAPVPELTVEPKDARGANLDEIPFTFIGSESNDATVDPAPLYDMAELNIAHYRNSADYEESVFVLGQPTAWFAGLTEHWVKNVLNGVVPLGSRAGIPLPEGASAGILQVQPNSLAFEAMEHKERQMVALGARLVEQKTVQRTATEAGLESAAETSTLTIITKNVSAAFLWALEWCGIFAGAITVRQDASTTEENAKIKFSLNTEFDITKMSPEQIKATIEAWIKEAITKSEMRKRLRQTGLAYKSDEEYEQELAKDQPQPGDPDYVETRFDAEGNPLPPIDHGFNDNEDGE